MGTNNVDILIIGAGFYGCFIALTLKERNSSLNIVLVDKENDIMQRASKNNQARIHAGYFFPKDISIAYRFFKNAPRFIKDFRQAIVDDYRSIYAISKYNSKITSSQFIKNQKGKFEKISLDFINFLNKEYIDSAFIVDEKVFNHKVLKDIVTYKLNNMGIRVLLDYHVDKILIKQNKLNIVSSNCHNIMSSYVFNCSYSQINDILLSSNLKPIPLKYEYTEMAEIKVPEIISNYAITIIDGPFFSLMPFPSKKTHTLSHVIFTKHFEYGINDLPNLSEKISKVDSNYHAMINDSSRFLPALKKCSFIKSIFEVKTKPLFPQETPMLATHEISNFYSVLGGKMDSIYELRRILDKL